MGKRGPKKKKLEMNYSGLSCTKEEFEEELAEAMRIRAIREEIKEMGRRHVLTEDLKATIKTIDELKGHVADLVMQINNLDS